MHMKSSVISTIAVLMLFGAFLTQHADAYVSVKGYFKQNGTYVAPYVRSNPNALKYDNYGYRGGDLYNTSYFAPTKNYSSTWYQPTYVTDPTYFTGKSLYDSNSSYSSLNISTPPPPAVPYTPQFYCQGKTYSCQSGSY